MPNNKGKQAGNSGQKEPSQSGTLAQYLKNFRGYFDDEFFRKFYDDEDEKREKFLEAYELTCGNVSASCRASGVPRRTYYNWMRSKAPRNAEFRSRMEEIKPGERLADLAELVILQHLMAGSLPAAKLVLTKNKLLYSRGYQSKPLETESLEEKEYQQLRRFIQKQAAESGVDYKTELQNFLNMFADQLNKQFLEKFRQELKEL
jgi:hypothetical protein